MQNIEMLYSGNTIILKMQTYNFALRGQLYSHGSIIYAM